MKCSSVSLSLLLLLCVASAHGARCSARDDTCWGAYARVAANELRRGAGVRALSASPAEALASARLHAEALTLVGRAFPRHSDDLPSGCGWADRRRECGASKPRRRYS
eukprot:IDg5990t1